MKIAIIKMLYGTFSSIKLSRYYSRILRKRERKGAVRSSGGRQEEAHHLRTLPMKTLNSLLNMIIPTFGL